MICKKHIACYNLKIELGFIENHLVFNEALLCRHGLRWSKMKMIITSTILLISAIMMPIMKCHGFSRSTRIGLTEICAFYQKISNLYNLCLSLKNPKKHDFKSTISPLL